MIKLVMLTGFLGSGKTTFLQGLIEEYKTEKIAVLINEFGAINIDAEIVRQDGIETVELSNGSIFCACIKDKFVESLVDISKRDVEWLFIEASGLADPASMPGILEGLKDYLGQPYYYQHSVCVVDGTNFEELSEVLVALRKQVAFSDYVLLNKTDIIDRETEAAVVDCIKETNPNAVIIRTSYCKTDIRALMESPTGLTGEWTETTNTYATRPQTVILKERKPVDIGALNSFLKEIAGSTYRIKGFINSTEGALEISCVGQHISISPWDKEIKDSKLVVISSVGIKIVSIVTGAMNMHLHGELTL